MKKKLLFILFGILLLTGCNKKVDYSKYSFTSTSWVRDNGHDTETLTLHPDGRFSYSCACGNPVNASDLCENYTYDDKNKEEILKSFKHPFDGQVLTYQEFLSTITK